LIKKVRFLTHKEHNVIPLERPVDVFSVGKKMVVYFENYTKQTNMLWENRSFIFRVKREGNQLIFKL